MSISASQVEKSRLGRLLVNRGYINESQLSFALGQQRASGQRLGEILVSSGWVTQREINRALRHQKRYRYAAAFAAVVATPLQPLVAFAATTPAAATPIPTTSEQQFAGLKPMSDSELGQVSGQGVDQFLSQIQKVESMAKGDSQPDSVETAKVVARTFLPVFNMLDAQVSIQGVHYDDTRPRYQFLADGSINMALPATIDQVSIQNIRPAGAAATDPIMGSITVSNIQFSADSHFIVKTH